MRVSRVGRLVMVVAATLSAGDPVTLTAQINSDRAAILPAGAVRSLGDGYDQKPSAVPAPPVVAQEPNQYSADPATPSSSGQPRASDEPNVVQAASAPVEAGKAEPKPKDFDALVAASHKAVFFDNDFSYICDPNYNQWWPGDWFKRRTLLGTGQLDMGGQFRTRAQFEQNMRGFGLTGLDDQFLLYRTRLFANWQIVPDIRFYAEYLDAESNYENYPPRVIEVNRSDFLDLFVDLRLWKDSRGSWTARLGRQELLYGAQRLISPLDWANTRRTFDGYKAMFSSQDWSVDAFWTNPVRTLAKQFDAPNLDQEFMGVYSQYKGRKDEAIDCYALRYINDQAANNFTANTFGARWQGSRDVVLWDHECAVQTGKNTDGSDRAAGMATFGFGRKLSSSGWKPSVWAYYDWASGADDLGAGNGFNQLFPLAHRYLGFMDLFGRSNIEDINFQLNLQPADRWKLLCWYHYLFLETQSDTPYNVNMTPYNPGNEPGSAELGHEIDLLSTHRLNAATELQLGWSHFFSGKYYRTTAGVPFDGDADFFYCQFLVEF